MLQKSGIDCTRKASFMIPFISGETWARHITTNFWLKENFFAEQSKETHKTEFLYTYKNQPNSYISCVFTTTQISIWYKATGRMAKLPLLEWFWSSEEPRNLGRHARNLDSTAEGRQWLMKPGTSQMKPGMCLLAWLERYHDPAGSNPYFSTDCCCLSIKKGRPWTASG